MVKQILMPAYVPHLIRRSRFGRRSLIIDQIEVLIPRSWIVVDAVSW